MHVICVGPMHYVYHVNFKAKKLSDDDGDAVLFFAEVELRKGGLRDPPRVVVCTILDATTGRLCLVCKCSSSVMRLIFGLVCDGVTCLDDLLQKLDRIVEDVIRVGLCILLMD